MFLRRAVIVIETFGNLGVSPLLQHFKITHRFIQEEFIMSEMVSREQASQHPDGALKQVNILVNVEI